MSKKEYYRLDKILSCRAQYNILLGQRSNGKSYAVKEFCLNDYFKNENKFILIRRFDDEIKENIIGSYFDDIPIEKISNNEYQGIIYYRKGFYLAKVNEDGELKRCLQVGKCISLSKEQNYKSTVNTQYNNLIFEEFISTNMYLSNEPTKLLNLVSTIARDREVKVFLIGNTISRVCPYFTEWSLNRIPRQAQGTIDIYNFEIDNAKIKIAVEYCKSSGGKNLMFFGSSASMINKGAWEVKNYPHIDKRNEWEDIYKIVVNKSNFKFLCTLLKRDNNYVWFIEPKTSEIKPNTRIISDIFDTSILSTVGFIPLNNNEKIAFDLLLKFKKVFYSDNLTATDFNTCIKSF